MKKTKPSLSSVSAERKSHSYSEDAISLFQAIFIFSLAIFIFQQADLIAGGTSGLALIVSGQSGYSFGLCMAVLNSPFYILAYIRMGKKFFIYTLITVIVSSVFVDNFGYVLNISIESRFLSAVLAGILCGASLLMLIRHRSSMGGLTILSAYLQERFGISAGKFQLVFDMLLMIVTYFIISGETVMYSVVALISANMVMIMNHKPGRYSPQGHKEKRNP